MTGLSSVPGHGGVEVAGSAGAADARTSTQGPAIAKRRAAGRPNRKSAGASRAGFATLPGERVR